MIEDRFTRSRLLFGDHFSKITSKSVLIFGVGGVGGFALDCLYRSGLGQIVIVDKDKFDVTNQNRQIGAEYTGDVKVKVLERLYPGIYGIEASVNSTLLAELGALNKDTLDSAEDRVESDQSIKKELPKQFDYVIDAIDDISAKVLLAKSYAHLPYGRFICSTGSAKKLNPLEIRVASVWKSYGDRFARKLRDSLKKEGFRGEYKVIFSPEEPKCKGLGSFSAVTASFGLQIASEVIRDIIQGV